jgi:hypothetical protein
MIDDAGLRLRVAILAMDAVGPLGAVWANWFGSAGARAARTSPMAAEQTRLFRKTASGSAPRRSADPIRPPHDTAKPTAVPAAVQFPAEQPAQTNLRGGEARRPRWRGERCTWLTSEVLEVKMPTFDLSNVKVLVPPLCVGWPQSPVKPRHKYDCPRIICWARSTPLPRGWCYARLGASTLRRASTRAACYSTS